MKKISVLCALGMLMCVVSCQKEKGLGFSGQGREIKVKLGMDQITKADATEEEFLFSVPFVTGSGETLSVEAYISDMQDDFSVYATKGAPVTTENLASVYGSFIMTVYDGDDVYTDSESGKTMSGITVSGSGDGSWSLNGGPYYWPEEENVLVFCSSAPSSATGISNLSWNKGEKLTFNYNNTPAGDGNDAKAQKDLIFGINGNTRSSHVDGDARYAWINFSHALTAVKFIKGDIEGCTIETVSLKNFKSSGNAEGTPSGSSLSFTWKDQATLKTYTQAFGTDVNDLDEDDSLDPTDDASCTFMMIPQTLDADACIEIQVNDGTSSKTIAVNLGSITASEAGSAANAAKLKDWSTYAGKVITIKVSKAGIAAVSVEDEVDVVAGVKSNLIITNTGTVDEYIRATIKGNWFTNSGLIVAPWNYDASDPSSYGFDGSLPTGTTGSGNRWIYKNGYYYYTGAVSPGQATGSKLFQTFTAGAPPIYGCHLEIEIIAQAVIYEASKDCWEAFSNGN
ncbi:MAG: fimbrillin family protein [Bacteroidia bacterium]|nr:fimbrillin family protein [Bacteroidia bacterium]